MSAWGAVDAFVERHPDSQWRGFAQQFICECVHLKLDRYFHASQSMDHLVFSTLHHHDLRDEPRVTVELHPGEHTLRIAYGRNNLWSAPPEIEYTLPFDAGVKTFQQFLKQLWNATATEGFPSELNNFTAPILPERVCGSPGDSTHGSGRAGVK